MSHGRTRCQNRFLVPRRASHAFAARLDFPIPATPRTTKTLGPSEGPVTASSSDRLPTNLWRRGASAIISTNLPPVAGTSALRSTIPASEDSRTTSRRDALPPASSKTWDTVASRVPSAPRSRTTSDRTRSRSRIASILPESVRLYTFLRWRAPWTWAVRSRTSPSRTNGRTFWVRCRTSTDAARATASWVIPRGTSTASANFANSSRWRRIRSLAVRRTAADPGRATERCARVRTLWAAPADRNP